MLIPKYYKTGILNFQGCKGIIKMTYKNLKLLK